MTGTSAFGIRQRSDGEYQVVRFEPVVLGVFAEYENAGLFLKALSGRGPADDGGNPKPVPASTDPAPEGRTGRSIAAPATPEPSLNALVPVDPDPDDTIWLGALDRIAAGERVKDVAEALGLPFGRLRSKWASAVRRGTHLKPDNDSPVSGGVGGVLARGKGFAWAPEQDAAIIAAHPGALPELAKLYGLSLATLQRRKEALEDTAAKMMREDAPLGDCRQSPAGRSSPVEDRT